MDQKKKLEKQNKIFLDNSKRILQQDAILEQLTLRIEDVENLIDEVSDEVYDKAVEKITDEVMISARKEDIKLVEGTKNWIQKPERKASRKEKQYALDRLDSVIKKIEDAMQRTIEQMKRKLLK